MMRLHHSIDEAALRLPDHPAFRFKGSGLSYQELVQTANQLAHALREAGVQRGDRVGVLMNKRLELPVAVYGILKAGGVIVPIDPQAPSSRIELIIRDCDIAHLVTEPSKASVADELARGGVVRFVVGCDVEAPGVESATWEAIDVLPDAGLDLPGVDQDLAYIMYTSGSTGTPKGLMHTHASGLAYARVSAELYGVRSDDRLGNHAALHFDQSTFEYFTGPHQGATTVLIPEEDIMFPASLGPLIEEERLTFWYSVPLTLVRMVEHGRLQEHDGSSLRWVLFGGEAFPPKQLWRLMDLWPNARFSNCYGPAEVNQCTYFHVPVDLKGSADPIPIGTFMPGAEGLIESTDGTPCQVNEAGELLVHSATMMQGYWGRPELTAAAIVDRERSPGSTETYYRTGDIVRADEQGILHFVGRIDRQVKVRGYRLELDEIENVIGRLEGVAEVAAFPIKDGHNNTTVAVIVLPQRGVELKERELRAAASKFLPPYALPDRLEIREDLPTTTSGKIDRRRLREMFEADLNATQD